MAPAAWQAGAVGPLREHHPGAHRRVFHRAGPGHASGRPHQRLLRLAAHPGHRLHRALHAGNGPEDPGLRLRAAQERVPAGPVEHHRLLHRHRVARVHRCGRQPRSQVPPHAQDASRPAAPSHGLAEQGHAPGGERPLLVHACHPQRPLRLPPLLPHLRHHRRELLQGGVRPVRRRCLRRRPALHPVAGLPAYQVAKHQQRDAKRRLGHSGHFGRGGPPSLFRRQGRPDQRGGVRGTGHGLVARGAEQLRQHLVRDWHPGRDGHNGGVDGRPARGRGLPRLGHAAPPRRQPRLGGVLRGLHGRRQLLRPQPLRRRGHRQLQPHEGQAGRGGGAEHLRHPGAARVAEDAQVRPPHPPLQEGGRAHEPLPQGDACSRERPALRVVHRRLHPAQHGRHGGHLLRAAHSLLHGHGDHQLCLRRNLHH
mmetsp:Transcript_4302/g.18185  ORF Transcript_4302/g.18185 Transcript_4302/m.18185 type:complete len:423 (-) Transcript_4302:293-1561(-)